MDLQITFASKKRGVLQSFWAHFQPFVGAALMISDALMIIFAFAIAHSAYIYIKIGRVVVLDRHPFIAVAFLSLMAVFLFWNRGHYNRRIPFWEELYSVTKVLAFLALLNVSLVILINGNLFSSLRWAFTWGYALICIAVSRIFLKKCMSWVGIWQRPAVIIGTGNSARDAYAALQQDKTLGYRLLAFVELESLSDHPTTVEALGLPVPVVKSSVKLFEYLKNQNSEVFLALEPGQMEEMGGVVKQLRTFNEHLHVITPLWGLPLSGMEISNLFSHDLLFMSLKNNLGLRHMRLVKRIFDVICASFLLMLLSPVFLLVSLIIKCTSPGPVFYGHQRVGRKGRLFKCYKFRTMVTNSAAVLEGLLAADPIANAEWQRDFKLKNDPRITTIGKILRDYSLDELPQLWSVLKGDMSLVGPRPIVEAELERYQGDVDYYLEVRPGLTGVWQVSGRNDVDYTQRVAYDVWYVKNWMLWYDITILFKTVSAVIKKNGAY